MKLASVVLAACVVLLAGCGGGAAVTAAATPDPSPSWDPSRASSPEIEAAGQAPAASEAPYATPAVVIPNSRDQDRPGMRIISCVLPGGQYHPRFSVTAEGYHAGPGLRDMRGLVGVYQAGVRVESVLVDITNVPQGTPSRGINTVGADASDPAQPFSCQLDAVAFTD